MDRALRTAWRLSIADFGCAGLGPPRSWAIVLGCAKILNAWPILIVVGVICIAEAICISMGYDSVYDTIVNFAKDKASLEILLLF